MQNYVCRHTLLLRCDAPPLAQILPQILASLRHWTCNHSHATGSPTHRSRNHHFRQPLGRGPTQAPPPHFQPPPRHCRPHAQEPEPSLPSAARVLPRKRPSLHMRSISVSRQSACKSVGGGTSLTRQKPESCDISARPVRAQPRPEPGSQNIRATPHPASARAKCSRQDFHRARRVPPLDKTVPATWAEPDV